MSQDHLNDQSKDQQIEKPRLSEDWISVIVGLAIVLLVSLFSLTSIPWPLFGMFK